MVFNAKCSIQNGHYAHIMSSILYHIYCFAVAEIDGCFNVVTHVECSGDSMWCREKLMIQMYSPTPSPKTNTLMLYCKN
jgi:hypothetical protein